jgi:hypothetical protein
MLALDFITWWYGAGWTGVFRATQKRLHSLSEMFSINILLRTLFSPWRRIISYPGAGLDARLRAFGDNIVSRCIGFTVRFMVLLTAAFGFAFLGIIGMVELVLWPFVPLAGVALIIRGLL